MRYDEQLSIAALLRQLARQQGIEFRSLAYGQLDCPELSQRPGLGCDLELGDGLRAVYVTRDCLMVDDQPLARGWYFYDREFGEGRRVAGSLNFWGGSLPRLHTVESFLELLQGLLPEN